MSIKVVETTHGPVKLNKENPDFPLLHQFSDDGENWVYGYLSNVTTNTFDEVRYEERHGTAYQFCRAIKDPKMDELKNAAKAYNLAEEYDICPHAGENGFEEGIDEWSGSAPYEIAANVMRIIDNL